MIDSLVGQFGWLVLIVAAFVIWLIFKIIRSITMKIVGIAFALISLTRLWTFFGN